MTDEIKEYPKFTAEMKKTHTILIPSMLPFHMALFEKALIQSGYKVEIMNNEGPSVVEEGLKYVHNDTCYPALLVIGQMIAALPYRWIIIPIGMVIGYFIVKAEPAVAVLNKQVEEVTGGAIPQRAMNLSLSIGVALSVGLAMTRVVTGISILWFLVPGYVIALLLSFKVPKIFTAIAFDSGGVASGPMTATFLLPLAAGACLGVGGNVVVDAFGVVAMVAMTPLITIQLLGIYHKFRSRRALEEPEVVADAADGADDDIITF